MQKCLHFSSLGRVGGCKSRDDAKVLAFRKMSKAKGKADTALPWANRKYNRFKGQLKTQETDPLAAEMTECRVSHAVPKPTHFKFPLTCSNLRHTTHQQHRIPYLKSEHTRRTKSRFKLKTLNLNTHSKTVSQTDHDMSSG
ncbi:hypothetical protein ACFX1T_011401 [Malus domestica]